MTITIKAGEKKKLDINTETRTFCTEYYRCRIHPDLHIKASEYKAIIGILERLGYTETNAE